MDNNGTFSGLRRPACRVGNGYDVHVLAPRLPLRLCGVDIESTVGCVAHSDGDVAIHALCDALLGALSLGDIGQYFPDTSDQWKGVDSRLLLKKVMEMVHGRGFLVGNVDVTMALQAPKVAPYIGRMRSTLAGLLGVEPEDVSVKATTSEGLGFVGRGEGVQVWANVMLFRADGCLCQSP